MTERRDEAALLGDRDEEIGPEHAARRMKPAHQRLDARHAPGRDIDLRLIFEEELAGGDALHATRWSRLP